MSSTGQSGFIFTMFDIARRETSLDAKRHELAAKVRDGRTAVAAMVARQAAMAGKIDEATAGLQRLERQLEAMDTVVRLFDEEELFVQTPSTRERPFLVSNNPAVAHEAPVEDVKQHVARRTPFRPTAFLQCLSDGHEMYASRSAPGHMTCTRCGVRRRV